MNLNTIFRPKDTVPTQLVGIKRVTVNIKPPVVNGPRLKRNPLAISCCTFEQVNVVDHKISFILQMTKINVVIMLNVKSNCRDHRGVAY